MDIRSKTSKQTRGFFASLVYAGWTGLNAPFGSIGYSFWSAYVNARYGSQVVDGKNDYGQSAMPYGGIGSAGPQFGGFEKPPPGTYETYRLMRLHPTLVIAQAAKYCPIMASTWGVEKDKKKAPGDAEDLIHRTFVSRRGKIVRRLLGGLGFGCASLEKLWGVDEEGAIVPLDYKYLIPDITDVVVDEHGGFMGVKNNSVELNPREVMHYAHEREGDNWYGWSRFEKCRRQWANAMAIEDTAYRLDQKAAGTIPYVGYPVGTVKDSSGNEVSNYKAALSLVASISRGQGVVYPNFGNIPEDDLINSPEIAKQSLWHWDFMDAGNCGPAQEAILNKLRYYDTMMVRAWCNSERALLQADTAGSRADSESHQDIGDADCEMINDEIAEIVNEQAVDEVLEENYGPQARGTVKIVAGQIVDENRVIDLKLLDAVLKGQATMPMLLERMDMNGWAQRTGIKLKEDAADWEEDLADLPVEPKPMPGEFGGEGDPETDDAQRKDKNDKDRQGSGGDVV